MKTSSVSFDRHKDIQRWREGPAPEVEQQAHGLVERLFTSCLSTLQLLIKSLDTNEISRVERNSLRRSLKSLLLWSEGHGVTTGALDASLDRSASLRFTTLSVLIPMCKLLAHGVSKHVLSKTSDEAVTVLCASAMELYNQTKWLLEDADHNSWDNDTDSGSSSDDCTMNGIHELVLRTKTYTACLMDLSSALICPALEVEPKDEPSVITSGQRCAHDYHARLIEAKFPRAQPQLLHTLGQISWKRYQRMQQEREAYFRAQLVISSDQNSQAAKSQFQDSGIGSSLPIASTYAGTTISFTTMASDGNRLNIPSIPAEAKNGKSFECVACGRHVRVTNNREWRSHLFLDLRPYTCLYANCTFSQEAFVNRQLWSEHMEAVHELGSEWKGIQCPLCLSVVKHGKIRVLSHLARHLEGIALASLPCDVESDVEPDSLDGSQSDNKPRKALCNIESNVALRLPLNSPRSLNVESSGVLFSENCDILQPLNVSDCPVSVTASTSPAPNTVLFPACDAESSGEFQAGNLAMHENLLYEGHSLLPCLEDTCNRTFGREGDRLTHTRRNHPNLIPDAVPLPGLGILPVQHPFHLESTLSGVGAGLTSGEQFDTSHEPTKVAVDVGQNETQIKCRCDSEEDDGNIVQCEDCITWQHIQCYYASVQHVPDIHRCSACDFAAKWAFYVPEASSSFIQSSEQLKDSNGGSVSLLGSLAVAPKSIALHEQVIDTADRNPPCNTLYVSNIPAETDENELISTFKAQSGYKRLCFRNKQNGPMCFVEFDDTASATKTMNELHGMVLGDSVLGGLQLSFSKNPLGVRSGSVGSEPPPSQKQGSATKADVKNIDKDSQDFTFVVAGHPDELRSKRNMTMVRKKAMQNYLKPKKHA